MHNGDLSLCATRYRDILESRQKPSRKAFLEADLEVPVTASSLPTPPSYRSPSAIPLFFAAGLFATWGKT